jgi:putative membrane protein
MSSEALPQRLHPAGIAVLSVRALRRAAFPLLAAASAVVLGNGLDGAGLRALLIALAGLLYAVVSGLVSWYSTAYSASPAGIDLRSGLLSRRETFVRRARIQALDVTQQPLQRLFGVVELEVQTAGGGKGGEVTLVAVGSAEAERLQALLHPAPADPAAAAPGPRPADGATAAPLPAGPSWRLSTRRLAAAALTSGQLGLLVPAAAGAYQLAGEAGADPQDAVALAPDGGLGWALLAIALLVAAWLVAAAAVVSGFAGFAVERDAERLRIRRGLISRRHSTVPVARVQAVIVVEGLFRQPFGLAALRVEVAGYASEAPSARTLFPLLRRDEVEGFLAALLPELAGGDGELAHPPARAARRYVLPPALVGLAVGIAGLVALPGAPPWPLAAALLGAALGALRYEAAGWRLANGILVLRQRRLARRTVVAPARRRQQHSWVQSPLQRRARLADLEVAIGAGTEAEVRHLDAAVAHALWERLALT